jgi:uncharacterized integral membrane protein
MKLRAVVLVVLAALLTAFMFANWAAITAPTQVSLIVAQVQAPLGLILLLCLVVVVVVFLFLMVFQQAGVILETRRYAKELAAQRTLADQAEASRFTELRKHLDGRLDRLDPQGGSPEESLIERIDRLEVALRTHIEHTGNSLAAHLGEVDDRVERLLGGRPPRHS